MKHSFTCIAVGALGLVALVTATPIFQKGIEVANLTKRLVPIFANWDTKLPNADANLHDAMHAFYEALELAQIVHDKPDQAKWDMAYNKYFQPNEREVVEKVFAAIVDGYMGSEYFAGIVVINYRAKEKPDDCEDDPDKLLAWITNIEIGEPNRAVMRLCPRSFQYPRLSERKCSDLDEEVSGKMSSLGGVFLHELTHFDPIGKRITGQRITDYDADGYGPVATRNFNNPKNVPTNNVDQYRWFSQEYYWSIACDKYFGEAKSNSDYLNCEGFC